MRTFVTIWFGQLISMMGSALTSFALGIWVYEQAGSVTGLALVGIFTRLPAIAVLPVAGVVADRYERRKVMILGDLGAGLASLAIAVLLLRSSLELWHIYAAVAVAAIAGSFQAPAFQAAIPTLVPRSQLTRAAAMNQVSNSLASILGPILAGALLAYIALYGIVLVDLATFLVAVVILLAVRFPPAPSSAEDAETAATTGEATDEGRQKAEEEGERQRPPWIRQALQGWSYLRQRPPLFKLLLILAALNLAIGFAQILLTPVILGFSSVLTLGTIFSLMSAGTLMGGLLMSAWGGPERKGATVVACLVVGGAGLVVSGLRPEVSLVIAGTVVFMFSLPILLSCTQAIWFVKVPSELQGRVFVIRRAVAWSALPMAYALAGVLSDRFFEPWMAADGAWAGWAGPIFSTGEGRGAAFLLALAGIGMVVLGILTAPALLRLESEVPDALSA